MYPHGGKYSDDPYFVTPEEEKQMERDNECRYCDGSGFFYSDPDLGPCNCVLDAVEPPACTCDGPRRIGPGSSANGQEREPDLCAS